MFFFSKCWPNKTHIGNVFWRARFQPLDRGKSEGRQSNYSDGFLHPALLPSYPLSLLLPVAFLKLKTDHSKNTSWKKKQTKKNPQNQNTSWAFILCHGPCRALRTRAQNTIASDKTEIWTKQGKTQRRGLFILLGLCVRCQCIQEKVQITGFGIQNPSWSDFFPFLNPRIQLLSQPPRVLGHLELLFQTL